MKSLSYYICNILICSIINQWSNQKSIFAVKGQIINEWKELHVTWPSFKSLPITDKSALSLGCVLFICALFFCLFITQLLQTY